MSDEEKLLTVAQVAERLQVNAETVRVWIRTGELDAVDIGNEYRISPDDLKDFLERRKTGKKKRKNTHD